MYVNGKMGSQQQSQQGHIQLARRLGVCEMTLTVANRLLEYVAELATVATMMLACACMCIQSTSMLKAPQIICLPSFTT